MKGIADYVFVDTLGQGSHGSFYLAKRPPRLPVEDELVAVKVITGSLRTSAYRRAVVELRAFASVHSPYLVSLFDAGQDGGVVYYAMRYHPMGSLAGPAQEITRHQRLRAITHAALATHALHEAGIVHRDIKPANILLEHEGARLSDLGLAQILNPGMTVSALGSLRSLEFVDPSVLRGGRVSRASDVWALGVSLHYTLTGHGIYTDLSNTDALLAIRSVMKQSPELDEALEPGDRAVIARAIQLESEQRYPTAAEFAKDVDSLSTASSAS